MEMTVNGAMQIWSNNQSLCFQNSQHVNVHVEILKDKWKVHTSLAFGHLRSHYFLFHIFCNGFNQQAFNPGLKNPHITIQQEWGFPDPKWFPRQAQPILNDF